MPTYMYKAVTDKGQVIRNKIEAVSKQTVVKVLKQNDLLPITVEQLSYSSKRQKAQKRNIVDMQEIMKNVNTTQINTKQNTISAKEKINAYFAQNEKIKNRDLVIFTQNFYLLKKANFNNIHALSTIIRGTENLSFKGILEDILAGVENGEYMYTTMEYYSNIFPYIYINMIKVGELSGSLTTSLRQAVRYLDETEKLNKKLQSILIPNIAQFILLLILLFVGSLFAIPAIQNVFDELGTKDTLPAVTIAFSNFLNVAVEYWYIPVVILLAAIIAIVFYIRTPKGKYNFHYFKYKMPVFGKLIFALDFSRLTKAMLLNLKNGMRIQEALQVSKNVVRNYVMLSLIETAINNILIGASWIEPFEKSGLASPMIIEMLKIGMQTDLIEMMEKLVEYMDMDIDNSMERITKVLPQIVYIIVGLLLIFVVIVVLVPCVQVYMGTFLFSAYGV